MKKKVKVAAMLFIVMIILILLGNHFINRYIAEKKIDQFIQDYGIAKEDISYEEYPLFNSLNSTPGFGKVILTKEDGDNCYIFEYDKEKDKVIFSANVEGNSVSIDDKLFQKLKHQPSDKVLQ